MKEPSWPRHPLPLRRPLFLAALTLGCLGIGAGFDALLPAGPDRIFHDTITTHHHRRTWRHVGIVVLDEGVPLEVGRIQLLPLFARATEMAVAAGAKAVYLDARLNADPSDRFPYARCIDRGAVPPRVCWVGDKPGDCEPGDSVQFPMTLGAAAAERFLMMPPIVPGEGTGAAVSSLCTVGAPARYPLQLLVGAAAHEKVVLVCADSVLPRDMATDGIERWVPLLPRHVAVLLASRAAPERAAGLLAATAHDERCALQPDGAPFGCRRVRPGLPRIGYSSDDRPLLRLSELADCDETRARAAAAVLRDRVVILQPTAFAERADLHPTAATVALGGDHLFSPGSQLLADSVETLLLGDHPRRLPFALRLLLLLAAALAGVLAGSHLRVSAALPVPILVAAAVFGLGWLPADAARLPPVCATLLASGTGLVATIAAHLLLGTRQGTIAARYLPRQVASMLLSRRGAMFAPQRRYAVILMSDLKGYTTVTGILRTPAAIFALLNDYLDRTTTTLQEQHGAWVEGYVGDMVCVYWPVMDEGGERAALVQAVTAAVDLAQVQRDYFAELSSRQVPGVEAEQVKAIQSVLNAGIGIAAGDVVMGNQGPKRGVQKFGILGDPLNLSSRLEGLTRHFSTSIIVTAEVAAVARAQGLRARRLGRVKVKGRTEPSDVFAIGPASDARFEPAAMATWEAWVEAMEAGEDRAIDLPVYALDVETLRNWKRRGLLSTGTWVLDEK